MLYPCNIKKSAEIIFNSVPFCMFDKDNILEIYGFCKHRSVGFKLKNMMFQVVSPFVKHCTSMSIVFVF